MANQKGTCCIIVWNPLTVVPEGIACNGWKIFYETLSTLLSSKSQVPQRVKQHRTSMELPSFGSIGEGRRKSTQRNN